VVGVGIEWGGWTVAKGEVDGASAAEVVRAYVELYNDGTPEFYGSDRFCDLVSDDIDWRELPTVPHRLGRSGDKAFLRETVTEHAAFLADRRLVLEEMVVDGNVVACWGTWSATVRSDLGEFATGDRLMSEVAFFIEVKDGLIVRERDYLTLPHT
jgi:ketosteroid isomerase-like protein